MTRSLSRVVLSIHSTLVKVERMGTRVLLASEGWALTLEDAGYVRATRGTERYLFAQGTWAEAEEAQPPAPAQTPKGKR